MSDQYEGKQGWTRVLFIAAFWLVFYLTQLVIAAVVIAQCLFTLISGAPNSYLLKFGESLSKYVQEILRYVTFNTDQRPFPFSDFPTSDIVITVDTTEA
ncbi:DUF4389 domain-containing protein [Arenicella xantha]|uniref:Uncharacterized protein DUF4389 n=1 Tax=Arenicella xantha TaxID=644221 RepID=A0A395JMN5_9GAMM|nr:DUF4389 domain-containing protein [Arenicella xantha]RBP52809.1 uncharacterized protein DUF4389 [Arenicella xantha]